MKSTLFLPLLFSTVYAQADTLAADRQRKKTCLDQCEDQDVDCKAICDHAPHPKPIHMNLMTECVQHCDVLKGDGNAVDLEKYGICRDGCIGGYMNLGNTQAAPTTKTWVDLVTPTPTSYLEKAVSETVSVSASASELEHDHSGHDHSHTEAAGNKSASATPNLTTISGLISTLSTNLIASKSTPTTSPSTSGQARIIPVSDKDAKSGASHGLAVGGSLIGAFVVGMILL